MATNDRPPGAAGLWDLFDASPAADVHTSPSALTALLCGVGAALTAPFSVTFALSAFLGLVGLVTAVAGLVGTSRPRVAGRALAPFGLVLSLIVLAVLGLRYLGVDTAFGDRITPSLIELLERLNARLPAP